MKRKITAFLKKLGIWRSLKVRLFLIILLMGLVPAYIIKAGILQNYEARAVDVRQSDVQNQLKIIANHLITYNYLQDTSSEVINAELEQLSNLYSGRVLIINGNLKIIKDTYGISEGKTIISEEVIKCLKGTGMSKYDRNNGFIEITTPITETVTAENQTEGMPEGTELTRGVMLTSVSTDIIMATMDVLNRKALILEIIMVVVVFAIAGVLANVLIRPFDRITKAIMEIGNGHMDGDISVPTYQETEHISNAFNLLHNQMMNIDSSRQDFVANVSHELKTPIAVAYAANDALLNFNLAEDKQQRDKYLGICQEQLQRLSGLVEQILSMSMERRKTFRLHPETLSLHDLFPTLIEQHKLKAGKPVEINLDIAPEDLTIIADRTHFSNILSNLIDNAIKYSPDKADIMICCRKKETEQVEISVTDHGIGIPTDKQPHIFDKFYRVPTGNIHNTKGYGLGLFYVKTMVEKHGGMVTVRSEAGKGSTFTIRI